MEISGSVHTTKSTRRGAACRPGGGRDPQAAREDRSPARARFLRLQRFADVLDRRDHLIHRMRIGDVYGNAKAVQSVDGFAAVDGRRQNQVRLERHDLLEIRIHRPAHVRLLRGLQADNRKSPCRPPNDLPLPNAKTISVRFGARETTRFTSAGTFTRRPVSSVRDAAAWPRSLNSRQLAGGAPCASLARAATAPARDQKKCHANHSRIARHIQELPDMCA